MKKRRKSVLRPLLLLFLVIALLDILPVHGEAEVYDKIIRLHVIANSDTEEDQALKLKVRDELLTVVAALTEDCRDKAEAEKILKDSTDLLLSEARRVLVENGSAQSVAVEIGQESYPTREYEGVRLPAGEYCSLRVMLGEAEGQNWWCVLFPPLCVGSATKVEEEMISVGFTPGQVKVLTDTDSPKYVLRFKFLEVLGKLFS